MRTLMTFIGLLVFTSVDAEACGLIFKGRIKAKIQERRAVKVSFGSPMTSFTSSCPCGPNCNCTPGNTCNSPNCPMTVTLPQDCPGGVCPAPGGFVNPPVGPLPEKAPMPMPNKIEFPISVQFDF